jgi:hypothetical protein
MTAADLLELALDHRIQAERSPCLAEQLELHRVADIYTVLATIDIPTAVLERLVLAQR